MMVLTTLKRTYILYGLLALEENSFRFKGMVPFQDNQDRTYQLTYKSVTEVELRKPEGDLSELARELLRRL